MASTPNKMIASTEAAKRLVPKPEVLRQLYLLSGTCAPTRGALLS